MSSGFVNVAFLIQKLAYTHLAAQAGQLSADVMTPEWVYPQDDNEGYNTF